LLALGPQTAPSEEIQVISNNCHVIAIFMIWITPDTTGVHLSDVIGGIALGAIAGIGLLVFVFGFGLPPGSPPGVVIGMIIAVITALAAMQTEGLD
jgi:anaerobic C4-dicarboxylate transporter